MRHLATIREIASLRPIAGADRIEVAQVDGWECVVQKGEFHTGEHIVYIEVDSIVPERPEFEFLRDRKFRVRTIKLRGQVSQGLVLPLSILPNGTPAILGADVTDALGIKKYDPEAQQEAQLLTKQPQKPQSAIARFLMRFKWYRKLFMKPKRKGGFPDWIVKTDETRIQNLTTLFEMEPVTRERSSLSQRKLMGSQRRITCAKSPNVSMSLVFAAVISISEHRITVLTGRLLRSTISKTYCGSLSVIMKPSFYKVRFAATRFKATNTTSVGTTCLPST